MQQEENAGSKALKFADTHEQAWKAESDLLKECIAILRQLASLISRTALLASRLIMLPGLFLLREMLGSENMPQQPSMFFRPLTGLKFICSDVRKRVVPIYTQTLAYLALPFMILRTLDRLATLFKQQVELLSRERTGEIQKREQGSARRQSQNSSTPRILSEATPITLPTTASQMYHAAILNNNTLDDLLASFDGERNLPAEAGAKMEKKVESQFRGHEDACREVKARNSRSGIPHFEPRLIPRTQATENLSSVSLPSRLPTRPRETCADGNDDTYSRCPSTIGSSPPLAANEDVHVDCGSGTNSKIPEPVLRCSAYEQRSSGTEESNIKQSKAKPRFDKSLSTYQTVPPAPHSKVPRRTRPCQAKAV